MDFLNSWRGFFDPEWTVFLSFRPVEFFGRLVHIVWSNLGPVWLSFCLSSFLSQAVQDLLIEIKKWSKERFVDPQRFLISKQNFFDTAHLNPRLLLNFSTYYWPPALATASVAKFQLICFFVPLGRRNNVNSTLLFFCPRGRHTHCVVSKHIMISPSVVATTIAQLQDILLSLTLLATSMAQTTTYLTVLPLLEHQSGRTRKQHIKILDSIASPIGKNEIQQI